MVPHNLYNSMFLLQQFLIALNCLFASSSLSWYYNNMKILYFIKSDWVALLLVKSAAFSFGVRQCGDDSLVTRLSFDMKFIE